MKFLFLLFFLAPGLLLSQRLSFQNYGVQDGLIQSQVMSLTQDKQQHLWIGTLGGIDRFDGTSFIHYTKKNAINSAMPTCLFTASNGDIWAGTFEGISRFNGSRFTNYPVEGKSKNSFFINIVSDAAGTLYAFSQVDGLYQFANDKFTRSVLPFAGAVAGCLFSSPGGLRVSFTNGDLYQLYNGRWQLLYKIKGLQNGEIIMAVNQVNDTAFAVTNTGELLKIAGQQVQARAKVIASAITSICVDNANNIWIGTNNGVQVFNSCLLALKAHYNAAAGLSDNTVEKIYKDNDGNIWIATDGDGLFRFSGELFSRYNKENGLTGNVVMGFAKDRQGGFYIATREGGLSKFNSKDQTLNTVSYAHISKAGINCIETDAAGTIYLGTMDGRLMRYDGKEFSAVSPVALMQPAVNAILCTAKTLWFAGSNGCYYIRENKLNKVKEVNEIIIGLLELDSNTVLMNGMKGAYEYQVNGRPEKIDIFQHTDILCFGKYKQYILVGTLDEGLLCWNRSTGHVDTCDISDGLSDNMVFSLYTDAQGKLWVGTGTGLQQVEYHEASGSFSVKRYTRADGYESVENSMNTITADPAGQVWIGTTRGAFRFNPAAAVSEYPPPYVVIQKVETDDRQQSGSALQMPAWNGLPENLVLPYNNSSISFTVKGIYFNAPASVTYAYELSGADTGFSVPTGQNIVSYKNLSPGKYIFRVRAFNGQGLASKHTAAFAFTVATPFYQTSWFKILMVLMLVLSGVLLQLLIAKSRQRKQQQLEAIRIKDQEQIRERTAEDFHDELGNKLARISLLAEMLGKKLDENETDKKGLVDQIKENALALYDGTKDIIWSLSPGSDQLQEILKRIQYFGNELYNDSAIDFSFTGLQDIPSGMSLPIDYSRNLVMICKEMLNNILRHAEAGSVNMKVGLTAAGEVQLVLTDNGKGFDMASVKKGNGLINIQRRVERINGNLQLDTAPAKGTRYILTIRVPVNPKLIIRRFGKPNYMI